MQRLSCTSLVLALLPTFSMLAQAQDEGTIFFSVNGAMHSVDGNGTNYAPLPVEGGRPSGLTYPNGRLFLARPQVGLIPDHPTGAGYADVIANDATGGSVQVTDFRGPLWVLSAAPAQWSNDNQDTFISFSAYDSATGLYRVYRAWVTGLDITTGNVLPLTPGDPRLELVLVTAERQVPAWNGDGSRFAYATADGVRLHWVASGPTAANDPLILSKAATGLDIGSLAYSPITDQIAGCARYASRRSQLDGIVSLNPFVQNDWRWIRSEYSSKTASLARTNLGGVKFSPDGSWVAYHGAYSRKGQSSFSALIKSPATSSNILETIVSNQPSGDLYEPRLVQGWCW